MGKMKEELFLLRAQGGATKGVENDRVVMRSGAENHRATCV